MASWLYNAAIHDSKKEVDIKIRKSRAPKIRAAAVAARIRARHAMVDLRAELASAARPEDAAKMLSLRFRQIDQEVANLKDGMASISTSIDTSDNDHTMVVSRQSPLQTDTCTMLQKTTQRPNLRTDNNDRPRKHEIPRDIATARQQRRQGEHPSLPLHKGV